MKRQTNVNKSYMAILKWNGCFKVIHSAINNMANTIRKKSHLIKLSLKAHEKLLITHRVIGFTVSRFPSRPTSLVIIKLFVGAHYHVYVRVSEVYHWHPEYGIRVNSVIAHRQCLISS